MSDQNVFDSTNTPQETPETTQATPPSGNAFEHLLADIKGPDGRVKYGNVEDALKGSKHAQELIPQLQQNNASKDARISELEGQLKERESVENLLQKFTAPTQEPAQQQETPQQVGLDEQAIKQLIQNQFTETTVAQQRQANINEVSQALVSKFGSVEKSVEHIQAKANELGMTPKELEELSSKQPKAALQLLGSGTQPTPATVSNSVNIPASTGDPQLELPMPEKNMLVGASGNDQIAHLKKIQEFTNARLGVTT